MRRGLSLVVEELHNRWRFGFLRSNVFNFLFFHKTRNHFLCANPAIFWLHSSHYSNFRNFHRNNRILRIICFHQQNLWTNQNRLGYFIGLNLKKDPFKILKSYSLASDSHFSEIYKNLKGFDILEFLLKFWYALLQASF